MRCVRLVVFILFGLAGKLQASSTISIVYDPYAYSGAYTDQESSQQYLEARYYDPDLERFVMRDSYSLMDRYSYVGGNPIMGVDPTGHMDDAESLMTELEHLANQIDLQSEAELKSGDMIDGEQLSESVPRATQSMRINSSKPSMEGLLAGGLSITSADGDSQLDISNEYIKVSARSRGNIPRKWQDPSTINAFSPLVQIYEDGMKNLEIAQQFEDSGITNANIFVHKWNKLSVGRRMNLYQLIYPDWGEPDRAIGLKVQNDYRQPGRGVQSWSARGHRNFMERPMRQGQGWE